MYIIKLDGVLGSWVNDTDAVCRGAIAACTPRGDYIEQNLPQVHPERNVTYPPYYNAVPKVVTTWSEYKSIIESYIGVIVVNTHGEYLPVPSGYTNETWVDKIAEAMLTRRVTWVHCGGYTFYRVWNQASGDQGEWTETVNNVTIGAGFRRLMNQTNLDNADLWPAPGTENELVEVSRNLVLKSDWTYSWEFEAEVGRPLKFNDFSQYVTMSIFGPWTDSNTNVTYYPGAVISFAKTNQRYTQNNGAGAYVHLGVNGFESTLNQTWQDADYGRGFIGTAAAVFTESLSFGGQANWGQKVEPPWGYLWPINVSFLANPLVSDYYSSRSGSSPMHVFLIFATYGAIQSFIETPVAFQDVWFQVDQPLGEWSNVQMKVNLASSRVGSASGARIDGLQDPQGGPDYGGLLADGTMWLLGAPGLVTGPAGWILFAIGGIQLLAQYLGQTTSTNTSGVGQFAPYIDFKYHPQIIDSYKHTGEGDLHYQECETFTIVELSIPVNRQPGWRTLSLTYRIIAEPIWSSGDTSDPVVVNDTLNLAIWIPGNAGQNDAGSGSDAGNTLATATPVAPNTGFHGYLAGDSFDPEDWYSFSFSNSYKKGIYFDMTPPSYVDFDVQLCNSSGGVPVASSNNPAGQAEHVKTYSNLTGPWYIRIYPGSDPNSISHSGVYSCSLNSLTGDINLDGKVNILDYILLGNAFLARPGDPNWNVNADINNDNVVNILDDIVLGNYFGHSVGGASGQSSQMGTPATGANTMLDAGAGIAVNPSQLTVFKGETFTVSVTITNVNDLSGWEFKLYWNSTVLSCTNAAIVTPTVWQGNTQDCGPGLEANYNSTHARFWKGEAANYPAPSFNGSMTIATLTFQALQPGTTPLALTDTVLGDSTAQPITCIVSSGAVNVYYGRYMRSDTQTVNGLGAYKLNIPESTGYTYTTQSGSGAGALWGIRAWVRHSNGAEQEMSLDGQTGTPTAVVWRARGSGMQSGTVSVAQTGLQLADSLVVRVYVQVGDSDWTLCATFTTEQLQATRLQAATWTVYYYTYAFWNRLTDWTTCRLYWGATTYNSQIQNLQYT